MNAGVKKFISVQVSRQASKSKEKPVLAISRDQTMLDLYERHPTSFLHGKQQA